MLCILAHKLAKSRILSLRVRDAKPVTATTFPPPAPPVPLPILPPVPPASPAPRNPPPEALHERYIYLSQ
ncbi:MAG: hypothetical protein E7034_01120 [Akkermansiaceae bacterium]|nr:hypothetical protein [Akkermansiaceae bacterium]